MRICFIEIWIIIRYFISLNFKSHIYSLPERRWLRNTQPKRIEYSEWNKIAHNMSLHFGTKAVICFALDILFGNKRKLNINIQTCNVLTPNETHKLHTYTWSLYVVVSNTFFVAMTVFVWSLNNSFADCIPPVSGYATMTAIVIWTCERLWPALLGECSIFASLWKASSLDVHSLNFEDFYMLAYSSRSSLISTRYLKDNCIA